MLYTQAEMVRTLTSTLKDCDKILSTFKAFILDKHCQYKYDFNNIYHMKWKEILFLFF